MSADDYLNRILVLKFADGSVNCVGRCYSYSDAPTVTVKLMNGTETHWRADLCEVIAMPDEAVELLIPACSAAPRKDEP